MAVAKDKVIAEQIFHRIREGIFILLMATAVFLFVSLLTYNHNDPGWSSTGIENQVHNLAGKFGSYVADTLLSLFGYLAYIFPAMVASSGVLLFKARNLSTQQSLWIIRGIGFFLALVAGCILADVHFRAIPQVVPDTAGGILGNLLSNLLNISLSPLGTTTLMLAMFLVGITFATGLSWLKLMDNTGRTTIKISIFCAEKLRKLFLLIKNNISDYFKREKFTGPILATKKSSLVKSKTKAKIMNIEPIISSVPNVPKMAKIIPIIANISGSTNFPNTDLLEVATPLDDSKKFSKAVLQSLSADVEARLLDFAVEAKVVSVSPGPIITRFELELAAGVKVSKISGLAKDLARSLSVTAVRVVEVIPGRSTVGLEIPNQNREVVKLREILESKEYIDSTSPLTLALGKDIAGVPVVANLARMPHLLVAGTTGSGKSVGVNAMLLSMLYKSSTEDLRLILIDPKMLELSIYEGIPHLLAPVVTDMKDAANALRWCVVEMDRRYQLMAAVGVRNLSGFNEKIHQANERGEPLVDPIWRPRPFSEEEQQDPPYLAALPHIVVIIDEFADMIMVVGKKVEELIARIAQKARAAGIHMILATQRPSVDVITGLIKANVPTRIAFQVSSRIDSRTILDQQGAEQLLGHGDMLYLAPGTGIPVRIHGAFVSDNEVHRVVEALRKQGSPVYIEELAGGGAGNFAMNFDVIGEDADLEQDDLYDQAVMIVTETRRASISNLQRRLRIGYNRAARLIEDMEAAGIVTEMQHNGVREVIAPPPVKN
jgi:DNA segregation ATPase FtsK/SpoIIIE, S-DNA-T family